VYGAIDVALSGEVDDGTWLLYDEYLAQSISIQDVALLKAVARMVLNRLQIAEIAGVGELIEIQQTRRLLRDPLQNEIRADESGAAGDENQIFHAGGRYSGSGSPDSNQT
jgi:hypothetical protein